MNRKIILLIIPMAIALLVSCGSKKSQVAVEEKAVAITVDLARTRDLEIKSVYTGTLEGVKQAQIYASIPEAVVELPFPEGSYVKAGQSIIYLDKEGTYSRYNQSRAVFLDAEDNFNKMKKLYEQGAVSEQAYNGARTGYDVASANYISARQQVELTSPINGILTDLSVNLGEYVSLGAPLATIAQTDKMRMTLYVDGSSAAQIRIGQTADINVDILGQGAPQFFGTVTEVSKSADTATRLFKVELRVDNKDGMIKPGMFARALLKIADLKSVLTISREAIFSLEGVPKVFTVREGRAVERTVSVGESTKELTHIISGLAQGDSVIVIGRNLVNDGSLVKVAAGDSLGVEQPASGQESDSGS